MTYDARVVTVMIASPSDVPEERAAVREVLADWNDLNSFRRKVVLLPLGWETHSAPFHGKRPQQTINDMVLVHADIVVAIFGDRVGTPTGKARSGTLEEINEQQKRGKPVMVYFADHSSKTYSRERREVEKVKAEVMGQGLIGTFGSVDDFRRKLERHIPLLLDSPSGVDLLAESGAGPAAKSRKAGVPERVRRSRPRLSKRACELLDKAANCPDGRVTVQRMMNNSTQIIVDCRRIFHSQDLNKVTGYDDALKELLVGGFLECERNGINEAVYLITRSGREAVSPPPRD